MNIEYTPHRQGYVVNPPERDEATGEYIGDSEVYENIPFAQEEEEEEFTEVEEDALAPEDRQPISELELAEISTEIMESPTETDPLLAAEIAAFDLGDSPSDVTISYLAHKVYQGDITSEEAIAEAINSGIHPDKLAASYKRLKSHFSN
jgi:hypothetical protein